MLTLPLPPGNYLLQHGIAAHITMHRLEEPLYPTNGKYNTNVLVFIFMDHGRIMVTGCGLEGSKSIPFETLPDDLKMVINDRFEEVFGLEHPPRPDSPRAIRMAYHSKHPITFTVKGT